MFYWALWFLLFAIGYFLTSTCFAVKKNKRITVKIIKKNGAMEYAEIQLGRDPEADVLIKKLKAELRKAA